MRQITKAMKLVSASRLRRAQERVTSARPYAKKLREVLGGLASSAGDYTNPLMEVRADEKILAILITADKGLCGAFNTNLLKAALEFVKSHQGKKIEFITIGRKGRDFIKRRNIAIREEYVGLVSKTVDYSHSIEIAEKVIRIFSEEDENRPDKVFIIYNEFKSALQQKLIVNQLLPIGKFEEGEASPASDEQATDYIYEQPPAEILGKLLPHYVETQIFQGLIESVASEHGARMTAMDSASKNATEVIDKLTLGMNRVRQASITREIIEVVSGAAAL